MYIQPCSLTLLVHSIYFLFIVHLQTDESYNLAFQNSNVRTELGRRAIYHATHRDAYSGGIIRVYHISDKGWVNVSNEDCSDLHYKYQAEKGVKDE